MKLFVVGESYEKVSVTLLLKDLPAENLEKLKLIQQDSRNSSDPLQSLEILEYTEKEAAPSKKKKGKKKAQPPPAPISYDVRLRVDLNGVITFQNGTYTFASMNQTLQRGGPLSLAVNNDLSIEGTIQGHPRILSDRYPADKQAGS